MNPTGARVTKQVLGGSRFEIAMRAPRPALRGAVPVLQGFDEHSAAPVRRREFPHARVTLILELGAPLRVRAGGRGAPHHHAGGFVAGLSSTFLATEHAGRQAGIELRMEPLAARAWLGVPLHELAQQPVSLDDLLPARARGLAERAANERDWDARFDLVEDFLERAPRASQRFLPLAWAARRIEASGGRARVGDLARELGYSRRRLIDGFRDAVGVTPKRYCRLVRFERLTQARQRMPRVSWACLAAGSGYFDESHLARDVAERTGLAPGAWADALAGTPLVEEPAP